jgi:hypothetical protein
MTAAEDVTARVDRGAALLDEKRPGWWHEIDLASLDLSLCWACVLGQLGQLYAGLTLNGYADGLGMVGLEGWEARDYGFDVTGAYDERNTPVERIDAAGKAEFEALTEAWRALITARKQMTGAPS